MFSVLSKKHLVQNLVCCHKSSSYCLCFVLFFSQGWRFCVWQPFCVDVLTILFANIHSVRYYSNMRSCYSQTKVKKLYHGNTSLH
ncbi:hypothetical protein XELAEV_18027795mg [Xenopus laevis]|uniref:Uncharacterized protein n=1 Tax=Xenopus laevis TaxID=8355 RepID=A0A974CYE1_XENLA|nr:hypothetical protein XELAEV_18027795mg [Xenopus laevis]